MNHCMLPLLAGLLLAPVLAQAQQGIHTVRGKVWRDYNVDGLRGAEESDLGVADQTVELWNAAGTTLLMSTQTNDGGNYLFNVLVTGAISYRVRVPMSPSQFPRISPMQVGNNPQIDSDIHPDGEFKGYTDPIVGLANVPRSAVDAGLDPLDVHVGNLAWLDLDDDGRQDAGEPGIAGITVEMWNAARSVRYATATTANDGTYVLRAPGYGSFRMHFSLPAGGRHSPPLVGSDTTLDSNVIATGADAGWTDDLELPRLLISISSMDAGYAFDNPADVALEYANVPAVVYPGGVASWTLWVRERAHRAVASVRVLAAAPAGMSQFAWQCTPQGGASCPSGGGGTLDLAQALPADAALRIDFSARAGAGQATFLATASATVAGPQVEVSPVNNSIEAILRSDFLFRAGFE